MDEIRRAVARGAAVLDHFYPDWEYRVKPEDVVTIAHAGGCVIQRVAGVGNYGRTMEHMFGEPMNYLDTVVAFACPCDEDAAYVAEWRRLITERRAVPCGVPA